MSRIGKQPIEIPAKVKVVIKGQNVAVEGPKATYVRVPTLDEVPYPVKMEPNLVVEYYAKN